MAKSGSNGTCTLFKRTLTDDDIKGFSREFEEFLTSSGLEIRR